MTDALSDLDTQARRCRVRFGSAQSVLLVADGGAGERDPNNGNVDIFGTINASGTAGGSIGLYGKSGVDLEGSLIATGSSTTEAGGTVELGTVGTPNTIGGVVQLDPTYGYELISSANSGVITLGASALIDVSGGTAGSLSGGTVNFRAPLLSNGDVNVTIAPSAIVRGSRSTTLEAFAVWSTDDPYTAATAAQHFDGIVDPAGWYDSNGNLLSGTFTTQSGTTFTYTAANGSTPASLSNAPGATAAQVAADLTADLTNDYFTPTTPDAAHQAFYGYQSNGTTLGTLMGFVENFPVSSAVTSRFANIATITPGIELDNPTPATGVTSINGGNISILTDWNLGAGTTNANGSTTLAYRYNNQAPTITFRAENDVNVNASVSDGFFQIANPTNSGVTVLPPAPSTYLTEYDAVMTKAGGLHIRLAASTSKNTKHPRSARLLTLQLGIRPKSHSITVFSARMSRICLARQIASKKAK